jgi:hypothetical protein
MTALILILLLAVGFAALSAYVRHDRFAGPRNVHLDMDDLGPVTDRNLVRL